jgi:hypothetical protein
MKILIVGDCLDLYLAKCHEAFRTGLRRTFDARAFGKGYPGFDPSLQTYAEILRHVFPEGPPDLIITHYLPTPPDFKLPYPDLAYIPIPKAIYLGDYWVVTSGHADAFRAFVERNGITVVLSYFPQPLKLFPADFAKRLAWMPVCVDPTVFNDWRVDKAYDVGFLAANTTDFSPFYPERYAIHQRLLQEKGLAYLWAQHPGWQMHAAEHPLVGVGYAKKINSCRIFITTSGLLTNLHAKYFEILASKSALFADFAEGASELHFRDGENYVRIEPGNVMDKIDYYLARPALLEKIAEAGYVMVMKHHSCYARAMDFRDRVLPMLPRPRPAAPAAAPPEMPTRLHVGFGSEEWPGFANIMALTSEKPSLRDRLMALDSDFPPQSLEEVSVIQALDILSLWEAREFFAKLRGLLRPGGKLILETASAERMAARILDHHGRDLEGYLEGVRGFHGFGMDDIESRRRFDPAPFSWSPWHLSMELEKAGFFQPRSMQLSANWRDFRLECRS